MSRGLRRPGASPPGADDVGTQAGRPPAMEIGAGSRDFSGPRGRSVGMAASGDDDPRTSTAAARPGPASSGPHGRRGGGGSELSWLFRTTRELMAVHPPRPAVEGDGRVLLVDDSPLVLEVLRDKLSRAGLEVLTCDSGRAALERAEADPEAIDLVIVDVRMPDLDGLALTRALRARPRTRQTPILLLTSLDSTDDTVEGLEAGADDFLTKSVSDGELVARVRSLIALGELRGRLSAQREAISRMFADDEAPRGADDGEPRDVVVVAHDNPSVRARVAATLDGFERTRVVTERDLRRAVAHLAEAQALDAGGRQGRRALIVSYGAFEALAAEAMPAGVVVMDDAPSAAHRIRAFEAGVEDYLPADVPPTELEARVSGVLRRQERLRTMQVARDQAFLAAIIDPLTGLYNRGYCQEHLRSELKRAERYGGSFALLMLDLDHFKEVNDTFGHPTGDAVLREIARRLGQATRASDLVARYGGEEFVIILPSTGPDEALQAADKIRALVRGAPVHAPTNCGAGLAALSVTVSVGVACCPADALDAEELVRRADQALYAAKQSGRDRVASVRTAATTGRASASSPSPLSVPTATEPHEAGVVQAALTLARLVSADPESPLHALQRSVTQPEAAGRLRELEATLRAVLERLRPTVGRVALADQAGAGGGGDGEPAAHPAEARPAKP